MAGEGARKSEAKLRGAGGSAGEGAAPHSFQMNLPPSQHPRQHSRQHPEFSQHSPQQPPHPFSGFLRFSILQQAARVANHVKIARKFGKIGLFPPQSCHSHQLQLRQGKGCLIRFGRGAPKELSAEVCDTGRDHRLQCCAFSLRPCKSARCGATAAGREEKALNINPFGSTPSTTVGKV